ncbi:hypothetical protein RUMTOR_00291 [[Ruminococcus] torques ATCC 27756]|uniref:Uncharacterized protein n=1 Tax=[Ruminococcus] torques ATCC 27756 TaxID=411460 RepID=A5KJ94_9FIRM|nr:hypothetical protein RUMTOR_00291 [[Ruminococcus] torques ATCC 27756]
MMDMTWFLKELIKNKKMPERSCVSGIFNTYFCTRQSSF